MIFNAVLVLILFTGQAELFVKQEVYASRDECLSALDEIALSAVAQEQKYTGALYDCKPFKLYDM